MEKAPPTYPMYAQDFLTGVMYLTNEEIGMYIKMLCKQWTDKSIPKKRLGFLVGYEWDNFSDELKSKFEDRGEYIINLRLERERDKKERYLEKQRENGSKGGRPPKKSKPNQNPSLTQKKPLEKEKEIEIEVEVVKEKEKNKKPRDLIFPFDTPEFNNQWQQWKNYKRDEFNFKYKSSQSEQAGLTALGKLSEQNEQKAIAIIHQSMENGWKGFFEIKTNGKKQNQKGGVSDEFRFQVAKDLGLV